MSNSDQPTSTPNFHHFITLKLTRDNYPLWRSQFLPVLRTYDLEGFINGSNPAPTKFLATSPSSTSTPSSDLSSDASKSLHVNAEYTLWYKQDQLLLSWLISSLSEPILAHVVGLDTSQQVWTALEKMFASTSKARALHTRLHLTSLRKGSMSISDYLQQIKSCTDSLASAGQPLSDAETLGYVLNGLGPEYGPLITAITTRSDIITVDELYGHLLQHESWLEHSNSNVSANIATVPLANVTSRSFRGRGYSRPGRGLLPSPDFP